MYSNTKKVCLFMHILLYAIPSYYFNLLVFLLAILNPLPDHDVEDIISFFETHDKHFQCLGMRNTRIDFSNLDLKICNRLKNFFLEKYYGFYKNHNT
jgi:hypothetical protein